MVGKENVVKRHPWVLGPDKFLSREELKILLKALTKRKMEYPLRREVWIDWFLVHLGLWSGLRVFEMANLNCGDLFLRESMPFIKVKHGKGNKERNVLIGKKQRGFCIQFLKWKHFMNESISATDQEI